MILAGCAAAAFALEPLGYRITIIALLIFFLGAVERRPPLVVGLVAIGFGFVSFYVIGDLLHVPLPRSRWGF
ncbi:Tripartite tricarboxylate transporter TctB family protein [compost metagenome]